MSIAGLWLSRSQRDVLIDHIDRQVPIIRATIYHGVEARGAAARKITTLALLNRGFLQTDTKITPTHTMMTETGRNALASALADWAEALVRANYEAEAAMVEPDLRWKPFACQPRSSMA